MAWRLGVDSGGTFSDICLFDESSGRIAVWVERRLRREVPERLRHDGRVETPLDEAAVRVLRDAGVKAVAVCFLYSFLDPAHETAAGRIVAEEFPEASFAPHTRWRRQRLSRADHGLLYSGRCPPGGSARRHRDAIFDAIQWRRHRFRHGGAAAGADNLVGAEVGAQVAARLAGARGIITFDMGGTSTDVALMQEGEARLAREAVVHGYPINAPMLDIHTVGAGGGSIAFVDTGGLLEVEYPLTVLRYDLVDGAGGAGRFLGGMGVAAGVPRQGRMPLAARRRAPADAAVGSGWRPSRRTRRLPPCRRSRAVRRLKIIAASGWFAARLSGIEAIRKIYADSFKHERHLDAIVSEAQAMVSNALGSSEADHTPARITK